MGLAVTAAHHYRIGAIGGLAHLDEAHGRQAQNPLNLQLDLAAVQVPEAFAEALQIAPPDLGHPALDRPDGVAVVEIELKRREDQRDRRAKQEESDEEARTNSAAPAIEGAPYHPDLREPQQSNSAIHVMLALRHSSCQIVVANAQLDGTIMVHELLGKRQHLTHQTRDTLAQRVVETFDMIDFARQFDNHNLLLTSCYS